MPEPTVAPIDPTTVVPISTAPIPPIPTTPVVPSSPPTSMPMTPKKSPIIPILISLLILCLLALAGYFYWQNTQLKQQMTVIPAPTASTDPTADWETYTNTEYGFSLKHPSNLQVSAPTDSLNKGHISIGTVMALFFENRRTLELEQIANDNQKTLEPRELPEFTFDGQSYPVTKAIFGEGTPGDERFPGCENSFLASTYSFDVNKRVLIYVYTSIGQSCDQFGTVQKTDNFDENIKLSNQILSTFKSVETGNSIVSTCKSVNLGLSLTLPSKDWICKADENLDPQQLGKDGTIYLKSPIFTVQISSFGRGNFCDLSDPDPQSPRYDAENACSISEFYFKNNMKLQTFKLYNQTKEIFGQIGNGPSVSITYEGMENRDLSANEKSEIISILDSIKSTN